MNQSNAASVTELSQILILPLRLEYSGRIKEGREDTDICAADWLDSAAKWIEKSSGGVWRRVDDLFQTLALFPGTGGHLDTTDHDRYAVAVYFHPFVRDLLFGTTRRAIQVLEHREIRWAEIQAAHSGQAYPARMFRVRRCHLFLFPSDIAVLTLQVDWNKEREDETLPLAEAQDLLNEFRRLYAPYYDCAGENQPGEVPARVRWLRENKACECRWGDESDYAAQLPFFDYVREHRIPPMSAHWSSLLAPLRQHTNQPRTGGTANDDLTISQILDDRVPAMCFVAIDPVESISDSDVARFAFLDSAGLPWAFPCSPAFLGKIEEFRYDRFWAPDGPEHLTTRYLCSGYNFLLLVSSRDDMAKNVVRRHFERHYFFLGLLAWQQKGSLLSFWHRLAGIVHRYSNEEASRRSRKLLFDRQKCLLDDLSDFVTRFYFGEVSNQVQPLELFRWWTGHIGTAALYDQVTEQAKLLRDVQFNHFEEEVQTLTGRLQFVATAWLPVSIAFGFLGFLGLTTVERYFGRSLPDATTPAAISPLTRDVILTSAVVIAACIALFWLSQPYTWRQMSARIGKTCKRIGRRWAGWIVRSGERQ